MAHVLDQREEDELHKSRLLNVEEKPFKRITRRLLTPGSLTSTQKLLPTPPPEGAKPDSTNEAELQQKLDEYRHFTQEVQLDFAAFDSSIVRIQHLQRSNAAERDRYAAEKLRILAAAQAVRENTTQLREQLEAARATLEQKKTFDELADKITSNRLLRPREDQEVNLRKLEEECRELEKESQAYAATWRERREQFGRIVEEGMLLRRLIRDEKEEVERREGIDGDEEDGEVGEGREDATPKPSVASGGATPRPEGEASSTPAEDGSKDGLKPPSLHRVALSATGSQADDSQATTPAGEDVEMGEETSQPARDGDGNTPMVDTPQANVDEPDEGEVPEGPGEDKMEM